jgi:large subunit ribosomal protein L13
MLKRLNLTKTQALDDQERQVIVLDAKDQVLGRIATQAIRLLQGKHKPIYVSNINVGDFVVIKNIKYLRITGAKQWQKDYTRYTGYPGGLRVDNFAELLREKPTLVMKKAISGMLPNNKLRQQYLKNLFLFAAEPEPWPKKIPVVNTSA